MKQVLLALCILFGFSTTSSAQFGKLLDKAKTIITDEDSDIDVSGGLKEALQVGVDDAVGSLSSVNGYLESPYKILIPEDAQKIVSTVSKLPGFKNVEKDLIAKMNEGAELAAKKAGPIFLDAIKQMSIKDASNILLGEKNAATNYLESSSRTELYKTFLPVITSALEEVNAISLWNKVVTAYNKVPFTKKLNPDLDDHVNNKALDGMFSLIAQKETGIREDVSLRTSPLLKQVFAKQD